MSDKATAVSKQVQVRLRYMEPADVQALFCMENDPEVWRFSDDSQAPYTWEQMEQFVVESPRDLATQGQLRLVIECGGRVVGAVDLYGYDAARRVVWVGILVWPMELRGLGIGGAALLALRDWRFEVDQFWARVDGANWASCRLFLGAGYTEQRREQEAILFRI